jgi:selenocysteine lyase/cysteine desulfurase
MNLDRRDFLRVVGAGAAGAALVPSVIGAAPATVPPAAPVAPVAALPPFDPKAPEPFWKSVKSKYPLDPGLAYFNTGGLGPAPTPVLDLFTRTMLDHQRVSDTGHGSFAPARLQAARFFGVGPGEICFTRNTTEGNSAVAAGLSLVPGDEVILDSHAHPGGSFPWANQVRVRGVVARLFEPDPSSAAGNLERIRALITPRTRLIQVSHVTAPTGIVMPVAAIAALARQHGAWFHVDGAQSAGMFPFGLRELGCDSFATSGHKWLGGPHETGILHVRKDRLESVLPVETGAGSGRLPPVLPAVLGPLAYSGSAVRYEYGTRNAASVVALAAALRFQDQVGRERIGARGRALADRVRSGLAAIPDVEILTPSDPAMRGSILTFRTRRMGYSALFNRLWKDYRMRCRPVSEQLINAVRVSTHLFNSPAECDRLVDAVGKILKKA